MVRKAKRYSRKTRNSVSKIGTDCFERLDASLPDKIEGTAPEDAKLERMLRDTGDVEEAYHGHLEEKRRRGEGC